MARSSKALIAIGILAAGGITAYFIIKKFKPEWIEQIKTKLNFLKPNSNSQSGEMNVMSKAKLDAILQDEMAEVKNQWSKRGQAAKLRYNLNQFLHDQYPLWRKAAKGDLTAQTTARISQDIWGNPEIMRAIQYYYFPKK